MEHQHRWIVWPVFLFLIYMMWDGWSMFRNPSSTHQRAIRDSQGRIGRLLGGAAVQEPSYARRIRRIGLAIMIVSILAMTLILYAVINTTTRL
jgi:peptidoglycan/LPS O-acetylase OafA/YrhL